MGWILFLQIIAIIFVIGLTVMVVMNFHKNMKEELFNKRVEALGKTLVQWGETMAENAKKNQQSQTDNMLKAVKALQDNKDVLETIAKFKDIK